MKRPTIKLWCDESDDSDRLEKFLRECGYDVKRFFSGTHTFYVEIGITRLAGFANIRTTFMGSHPDSKQRRNF